MKKLTKEETATFLVGGGAGRRAALLGTELFTLSNNLEIGEAVNIPSSEWPLENVPNVSQLNRAHLATTTGKKFLMRTLPMHKGYVFIRVE